MVAVFLFARRRNNYYFCDYNSQNTMAENKKEMERAELHRTIWAIADEMRGAVDG